MVMDGSARHRANGPGRRLRKADTLLGPPVSQSSPRPTTFPSSTPTPATPLGATSTSEKAPKIAEQLMEIQHKYPGLEVVNVGQPVGTSEAVILEQLDRFAAQVIPAFKRT